MNMIAIIITSIICFTVIICISMIVSVVHEKIKQETVIELAYLKLEEEEEQE